MKYLVAAAVLLHFPAMAGAAGEWRYSNPTTSDISAQEPESMNSGANDIMPGQTGEEMQPTFAGSAPVNNTLMTRVREQFGQPGTEAPAVGKPPIARWYYSKYTVYFEFDRVITSVIN